MTEEADVREQFKSQAKQTGLCEAFKVFNLGSHGTVFVGCGLPDNHDEFVDVDDPPFLYHQSQKKEGDGALVIFRWPV